VVRVFKNSWFHKFARKERIADTILLEAIERVECGLIDADLGGGVIKIRIARADQGKSSGYRTIVLYRQGQKAFFVFGYAKSERANIGTNEETMFRKMARDILALSDAQIAELIDRGSFSEVHGGKEI